MSLPLLLSFALLTTVTPAEEAPVQPVRLVQVYTPPKSAFGPGHRGVDLAAQLGQDVLSPTTGILTFCGRVAGRNVIVVRAGARVFSLEPAQCALEVGTPVIAGQRIGRVSIGGHCSLRCLHLGLRVGGQYSVPLVLHARLVP